MDYKKFYIAVRRYAKKRISRGEFVTDWKDAQRSQGMNTKKLERTATA
jgi:hypothetical protein